MAAKEVQILTRTCKLYTKTDFTLLLHPCTQVQRRSQSLYEEFSIKEIENCMLPAPHANFAEMHPQLAEGLWDPKSREEKGHFTSKLTGEDSAPFWPHQHTPPFFPNWLSQWDGAEAGKHYDFLFSSWFNSTSVHCLCWRIILLGQQAQAHSEASKRCFESLMGFPPERWLQELHAKSGVSPALLTSHNHSAAAFSHSFRQ